MVSLKRVRDMKRTYIHNRYIFDSFIDENTLLFTHLDKSEIATHFFSGDNFNRK